MIHMTQQFEIFEECQVALENEAVAGLEGTAAGDLLCRLGYWDASGEFQKSTPHQQRNHLSLLRLAARFRDFFELPVSQATGLHIAGALVNPQTLGIHGHGIASAGVGGRGFSFRRAFESCVGEAAEYLSFIERDSDPLMSSAPGIDELNRDEIEWAFSGAGLGSTADASKLTWVEATSLVDHRRVRFPSELVLRRPPVRRTGSRQAESNGVGAGPTIEDAQLSGLLEVIERDAVALWWFGGLGSKEVLWRSPDDEQLRNRLASLRDRSSRPHWFLDLTTDVGVPVVGCISSDGEGRAVVAGFSASADMAGAIEAAFLEMCQMEVGLELALAKFASNPDRKPLPQDQVWMDRYNRLNIINFPRLRQAGGPGPGGLGPADPEAGYRPLDNVVRKLHRSGFTPYFVDITRSEIAVPVARMLVPGLQSAKPDWMTRRLFEVAARFGVNLADIEDIPSPI